MMTTIFLTVYGKQGMKELAEQNLAKAAYLKSVLTNSKAANSLFDGAPQFHEFVLETSSVDATELNKRLLDNKIIGGLTLQKWYPELGPNATLWCATELTTRVQMDDAAKVVRATRSVYEDRGLLTLE
jgi:glycine dehydrogenase subunit 1